MNTIPELADQIRRIIDTDNDGKRLVVEHILPLIGVHAYSLHELERTIDNNERLRDAIYSAVRSLENDLERYKDVIPEEALDALTETVETLREYDNE